MWLDNENGMVVRNDGASRQPISGFRAIPRRDGATDGGAADALDLSPEVKEKAIDAWRIEMRAHYRASTDPDVVLAVVEAARNRLHEPGLLPGAQATLHMTISGAFGRLVELGCNKVGNGKRAFEAMTLANDLAPTKHDIAEYYGRTLLSFAGLNWGKRKVVTFSLEIDLDLEIRRSIAWLEASPVAPVAVLLRVRLADALGDGGERRKAEEALAMLERTNPEALAAAREALDGDRKRVLASK